MKRLLSETTTGNGGAGFLSNGNWETSTLITFRQNLQYKQVSMRRTFMQFSPFISWCAFLSAKYVNFA